jgi:hypothetical protein
MLGHLIDAESGLGREGFAGSGHCFGLAGPRRRDRPVAVGGEVLDPWLPCGVRDPQSVDETMSVMYGGLLIGVEAVRGVGVTWWPASVKT